MNNKPVSVVKTTTLVILSFATVSAALLFMTKVVTKDRIELNRKLTLLKSFNQLLAADEYDNDLVADVISIKPAPIFDDKQPVANLARKNAKITTVFLRPVAREGYSGKIHLLLAVKRDKSLFGVRVLRHKETPGLGDNIEIRKSAWIKIFKEKSLHNPYKNNWKVKKDGGKFDQLTGATITPRAIVKTVKNTLLYVEQNYHELFDDK